MALSDSLTISPDAFTGVATNQATFTTLERGPKETKRLNEATTLSDPEYMVVKHQVTGSEAKGDLTDRHLVQLSRVERDADGVAHPCVLNFTLSVPRVGLFTEAEVTRQVYLLANFLKTSGVMAKILTNQT